MSTGNPWLKIPAADYEGHMSAPEVGQLAVLNQLFRDAYNELRPQSLAVLGCATGNGFEHIDPAVTARVVGLDINPEYLKIARRRYGEALPGLELYCADLEECTLDEGAFDLAYGALLFEYVDVGPALRRISGWLKRGGMLAAVLQLESLGTAAVTPTAYDSLKLLEPLMRLVAPADFLRLAATAGLIPVSGREVPLASGKRFWTALLSKRP